MANSGFWDHHATTYKTDNTERAGTDIYQAGPLVFTQPSGQSPCYLGLERNSRVPRLQPGVGPDAETSSVRTNSVWMRSKLQRHRKHCEWLWGAIYGKERTRMQEVAGRKSRNEFW